MDAGGFAIFGTTQGVVKVDDSAGQVKAIGMQFAVGGYVLNGDTLTLVGAKKNHVVKIPIIRVGNGSKGSAGDVATIDAPLAGNVGFTKTDYGTLILAGKNTYAGATTIDGGTLEVAKGSNLGQPGGYFPTHRVLVDNSAGEHARLKVDAGATLSNDIVLKNGARLDNAGTLDIADHTSNITVYSDTGLGYVANTGVIKGKIDAVGLMAGGHVGNDGGSISSQAALGAGVVVADERVRPAVSAPSAIRMVAPSAARWRVW